MLYSKSNLNVGNIPNRQDKMNGSYMYIKKINSDTIIKNIKKNYNLNLFVNSQGKASLNNNIVNIRNAELGKYVYKNGLYINNPVELNKDIIKVVHKNKYIHSISNNEESSICKTKSTNFECVNKCAHYINKDMKYINDKNISCLKNNENNIVNNLSYLNKNIYNKIYNNNNNNNNNNNDKLNYNNSTSNIGRSTQKNIAQYNMHPFVKYELIWDVKNDIARNKNYFVIRKKSENDNQNIENKEEDKKRKIKNNIIKSYYKKLNIKENNKNTNKQTNDIYTIGQGKYIPINNKPIYNLSLNNNYISYDNKECLFHNSPFFLNTQMTMNNNYKDIKFNNIDKKKNLLFQSSEKNNTSNKTVTHKSNLLNKNVTQKGNLLNNINKNNTYNANNTNNGKVSHKLSADHMSKENLNNFNKKTEEKKEKKEEEEEIKNKKKTIKNSCQNIQNNKDKMISQNEKSNISNLSKINHVLVLKNVNKKETNKNNNQVISDNIQNDNNIINVPSEENITKDECSKESNKSNDECIQESNKSNDEFSKESKDINDECTQESKDINDECSKESKDINDECTQECNKLNEKCTQECNKLNEKCTQECNKLNEKCTQECNKLNEKCKDESNSLKSASNQEGDIVKDICKIESHVISEVCKKESEIIKEISITQRNIIKEIHNCNNVISKKTNNNNNNKDMNMLKDIKKKKDTYIKESKEKNNNIYNISKKNKKNDYNNNNINYVPQEKLQIINNQTKINKGIINDNKIYKKSNKIDYMSPEYISQVIKDYHNEERKQKKNIYYENVKDVKGTTLCDKKKNSGLLNKNEKRNMFHIHTKDFYKYCKKKESYISCTYEHKAINGDSNLKKIKREDHKNKENIERDMEMSQIVNIVAEDKLDKCHLSELIKIMKKLEKVHMKKMNIDNLILEGNCFARFYKSVEEKIK
ncbi:hypothetical protein PFLG_02504 [Plasmodium falciparum RAJ116]|uniref:Uncharacterized protein n=1 Tax=Plasmodium falciparum RAJ116 TaxID=580058 RepID=A0A0L0D0V3_PLAFA|nr:hypothetical protein PFLG_02504 [Plasmodium falciparum RAJ116]